VVSFTLNDFYCLFVSFCPDYKHIMRDEAMVTAGELGQKYESAEAYEDDFM
jgi:hypothetical protein